MKKIIAIVSAAVLLLGLMACNGTVAVVAVPITWIGLFGPVPEEDGTAELSLDFSEPIPGLTNTTSAIELNKIFSFAHYAKGSTSTDDVKVSAVSITPDASGVGNLYTLKVQGAPKDDGKVQVTISRSDVRPPTRPWELDGSGNYPPPAPANRDFVKGTGFPTPSP
jgi:hypothetical protein